MTDADGCTVTSSVCADSKQEYVNISVKNDFKKRVQLGILVFLWNGATSD